MYNSNKLVFLHFLLLKTKYKPSNYITRGTLYNEEKMISWINENMMHELTVWIDFVVVRTLVHFFVQRENVSINRNELSPSPTQPNQLLKINTFICTHTRMELFHNIKDSIIDTGC